MISPTRKSATCNPFIVYGLVNLMAENVNKIKFGTMTNLDSRHK